MEIFFALLALFGGLAMFLYLAKSHKNEQF